MNLLLCPCLWQWSGGGEASGQRRGTPVSAWGSQTPRTIDNESPIHCHPFLLLLHQLFLLRHRLRGDRLTAKAVMYAWTHSVSLYHEHCLFRKLVKDSPPSRFALHCTESLDSPSRRCKPHQVPPSPIPGLTPSNAVNTIQFDFRQFHLLWPCMNKFTATSWPCLFGQSQDDRPVSASHK